MNNKLFGLLILTITLLLAGCGDNSIEESSSEGEDEKLKINTTVYPLQFFTKRIAGDAAEVNSILPPGSDAHTYEPTTKEMIKLADADAFIYNGAGLETYAEKISDSIDSEDVKILEAAHGMNLDKSNHDHEEEEHDESEHTENGEEEHDESEHAEDESDDGHNHGENDPHLWLDPVRSIQLAENIKDMLVELQPDSEDQFNENFKKLKADLETLDHDFHEQVEDQDKNKIIVSHAAYGYWEQAYNIEQVAVSGLSPSNEPSQKQLEEIIEIAEKHNLKYVFFEQNITPKISEVVQKEIGAQPLRIHNLSVLTEDDLEAEEDYFSLMERNLEVLNKALN
ncbi:metal ABC transporter solute-binding protein, Zn/Mn family [Halobacillus seohaensis]|uniref:Metal ABC transporter solute-binding protein, Zn/Mn family n=1 Tax=Halobacillus seohaensis TaxID=447421 RepID=A0ABW2EHU9_9BACI